MESYKHYAVWLDSEKVKDITKEVDNLIENGDEKYSYDFANIVNCFQDKLDCEVVVGSCKSKQEAIKRARKEVKQY